MIKKLLADKDKLFLIGFAAAAIIFLVEVVVLILYRETWFDELNYLWKSYLVVKGELVPFKDAIVEYPPLFIPLYGFGQAILGPSLYLGRIVAAGIFALLLLTVFLLAKKMGGRFSGLAAVFLILSNLFLVSNYISSTLYSLAALLLVLIFLVETSGFNQSKKIILSSILIGLIILTRTNLVPVLFVWWLYLVYLGVDWKKILCSAGLVALVVIVVYLPIVLPNPQVALSHILHVFYNFGPMKELPVSTMIGSKNLENFISTLVGFLKEYYPFLLLFFSVIFYAIFENRRHIKQFFCQEVICPVRKISASDGGSLKKTNNGIDGLKLSAEHLYSRVYWLMVSVALILMLTHFFYWRLASKVIYANYFMPLIALAIAVAMTRFLPEKKLFSIIFIFVLLLNFSISLYRTDAVSNPKEESDLKRLERGAKLIAAKTKKDDRIFALDNSIFHIFLADRRTFPPLLNRNFLYAPELSTTKAQQLKFYNFEMMRHWLLKEADFVALHEESWNLAILKGVYWGDRDEEALQKIKEISEILQKNYELVGMAKNVYPRKYTEGNDGGTLLLYKNKNKNRL